jgi:acyl carrier protein
MKGGSMASTEKQNSIYSLNSIDIEESLPCEPPVGEIEEELALIWSKVLKIKKVGRHDNFFELGGDSLKASRIIIEICDFFGMELPIRVVFELQTIKDLSKKIEETYNEVLGEEEMDEGFI